MEPQQITEERHEANIVKEATASGATVTMKQSSLLYGAIAVAILFIIVAFLFTKGFIVAATVNGSPISRLAVIEQLESQGGKQALEAIINERLIEAELKKNNIVVSDADVDIEIKKIEEQVAGQGGTLIEALEAQGMTMDILREQIASQKGLEALLAEKIVVTDAEMETALKSAEGSAPEGMTPEELKTAITEQLKQQKFQVEAQTWVASLTTDADIKYFVTY